MSLLQNNYDIINNNNAIYNTSNNSNTPNHNTIDYCSITISNVPSNNKHSQCSGAYKCSKKSLTSPAFVQSIGYIFLIIVVIILHTTINTTTSTHFFSWGVPVKIFNYTIKTDAEFYLLLSIFFIHEIINAWVSQVVYPWIINNVQDSKCKQIKYSNIASLIIINANNIYGTLDIVFIISSINSQVSFLLAIILAQTISSTIINYRYLLAKTK